MTDSHHPVDPAFLAMFSQDVGQQVEAMEEILLMVKRDHAFGEYTDDLIHSLTPLAQGARMVKLLRLAAVLERFLERGEEIKAAAQEQAEEWMARMDRAIKLLKEASEQAPENLPKWEEENETPLSQLAALGKNKSSEKPLPKPVCSKKPEKESPLVQEEVEAEPAGGGSMQELFRVELEERVQVMTQELLKLEQAPRDGEALAALMRAAHSVKGAARVVHLPDLSDLAHVMEEVFVGAQQNRLTLTSDYVDILLKAVDFLGRVVQSRQGKMAMWVATRKGELVGLTQKVAALAEGRLPEPGEEPSPPESTLPARESDEEEHSASERVVRVTADNLEHLIGLAGQSLVESRWLQPFSEHLVKVKRGQQRLSQSLDRCYDSLLRGEGKERLTVHMDDLKYRLNTIKDELSQRLSDLDTYIRRHSILSDQLYHQAVFSRMRPFKDGVQGYPRMVRDLAKQLGKKARLEILGQTTSVDRDILEKLEGPLTHLIRNSVDHGIEAPEVRERAGKPPEGMIFLEARHRAGMLHITIGDDGKGVDCEAVRRAVVRRRLNSEEVAASLTEGELLEFLFLPGFSTSEKVTDISGRGVGLDVVRSIVQEVGGRIRAETEPGKGLRFFLQLPLTLSVVRSLVVEIAGEPYAFPLSRIHGVALVLEDDVETVEGRQFYNAEEQNIGLVSGAQILGKPQGDQGDILRVVLLKERMQSYGVVVDRFLGDKELVVQELDPALGKPANLSAGALLEDGSPLLILDVEDLLTSMQKMLHSERLRKVTHQDDKEERARKRILVVEDSITVRELESRLLRGYGYEVDMAVDGLDGWNALRMGQYDLVVTDVDMPRMNGIELVSKIRADDQLSGVPVIIVSYKESEAERKAGLDAGANYYFTKRSFHDERLVHAVRELIGGLDDEETL